MIQNIIQTFQQDNNQRIYEGTFVHGPGGVGKSHLIISLIQLNKELGLNYEILCPTQQSVQNLINQGNIQRVKDLKVLTIHSFFRLSQFDNIKQRMYEFKEHLKYQGVSKFNQTNEIYEKFNNFRFKHYESMVNILRNLDMIMIEEVSMMDPDFLSLLDIYSQICRNNSNKFGGIQVFIFGDSFQLQPVQEIKSFYFESHIFRSGYFNHMLELNQSVRQQDDLVYFQNILQPIRKGEFEENAQNFYDQINKLKQRIVDDLDNDGQLKVKYNNKEQIIALYFKNENVDLENQRRAKKEIQRLEEERERKKNNQITKWRQFVQLPIQFTFGKQQDQYEICAKLLGQNYGFTPGIEEHQFSHYANYLRLPLGIRNYLACKFAKITYKIAIKQKDFNRALFQTELTLFKKAEIVIRKNLDKSKKIINGQFGRINKITFDLDLKSIDNMYEMKKQQEQYIEQKKIGGIIYNLQTQGCVRFTTEQKDKIREYLEINQINNINYLHQNDVIQGEKWKIYEEKIEPRVATIDLKLSTGNEVTMEIADKDYIQEIQVKRQDFIGTLQNLLLILGQTLKYVEQQTNRQRNTVRLVNLIYKYLMENELLEIFGIDIINNTFNQEYLKRTRKYLQNMIEKLPETIFVYLHQLPINLGYARTIHTAQGATLQNVIIDLDMNSQQQHGLLYTAMSRVRKLENLFLHGDFSNEIFKVRVPKEIKKYFELNFKDINIYLQEKELLDLLEKPLEEIIKIIKENSNDFRLALIFIKQSKNKVQNNLQINE